VRIVSRIVSLAAAVHAAATQGVFLRLAGLESSAADRSRAHGEGSTGAAIDAQPLRLRINVSGSLRRPMAYAGARLRITAAIAHALKAIGGDARWLAARAHAGRPQPQRAPIITALRRWCVDLVPCAAPLPGLRRSWRRGDGSSRCHSTRAQRFIVAEPDARRERRRKAAREWPRASAAASPMGAPKEIRHLSWAS